MADGENGTVRAYVPAYQKEQWRQHARELEMSLSEYVRAMVVAGRDGFGLEGNEALRNVHPAAETPGDGPLEDAILDLLADEDHLDWDDIVERLTGDFEERVDETLDRLQHDNHVRYSGRHEGYTLVEDER